ncbi:MAG: VOC family protein [Micrococcales bacterium]|nr:VOC family protein [Micrococcales bacterium]
MDLENIVIDSAQPQRLGRFWAAALGAEPLTQTRDLVEVRLSHPGGPILDVCLPKVLHRPRPTRLRLDLRGGQRQKEVVRRLVSMGAAGTDSGQRGGPWVVLADPEGHVFRVLPQRGDDPDTGPIAAIPIDSAAPERDAAFWQAITGWSLAEGVAPVSLRHPCGRGPVLEFWPEPEAKGDKNQLHLDVRLGPGETA